MSIFIGILLTLLVFFIVVLVHELGHFSMARLTGMKVLEFGFGIPPKLFRFFRDQKGTEYTINALPIGGFVRIKGEDPTSLEALDPDSFSSKSWGARALVLIAGVTMNFLLAIVLFFILFTVGVRPVAPNFLTEKTYDSLLLPSPEAAIEKGYLKYSGIELTPVAGSIAEKSGILPGDLLIAVDAAPVSSVYSFMDAIDKNMPLGLTLMGTGGERSVTVVPEGGKLGVQIRYTHLDVHPEYREKHDPKQAIMLAMKETYVLSYMTIDVLGKTLKDLIFSDDPKERESAKAMISGPIGIGSGFIDMVQIGLSWEMFAIIVAMISLNLGVFNLLPFPALDGGRLVSTSISSMLSYFVDDMSKLSRIETYIHGFGMMILIILSLIIAFFDVSKLF